MLNAKTYIKTAEMVGKTGVVFGDNNILEYYGCVREDHGIDEWAYMVTRPDNKCHRRLVKEDARGRKYIAIGGEHIYLSEFMWA